VVFNDVHVVFSDVRVVFSDGRVVFDDYQISIPHTPFPLSGCRQSNGGLCINVRVKRNRAEVQYGRAYSRFGQRTDSTNAFDAKAQDFWYFVRDRILSTDFFPLRGGRVW